MTELSCEQCQCSRCVTQCNPEYTIDGVCNFCPLITTEFPEQETLKEQMAIMISKTECCDFQPKEVTPSA